MSDDIPFPEPEPTPFLRKVPAICSCGLLHEASTLRPYAPGQPPIPRKCDACIDKEFARTPVSKALNDPAPMKPPRKVFGYDD